MSFAAVLGRLDPASLHTTGTADEIVVQRYQEVTEKTSWVVIRSAESADSGLILASEAVPPLGQALLRSI